MAGDGSRDPSWIISAALTFAFVIGAGSSRGALAIGWLILAIGMFGVTVLRYRASRDAARD